MIATIGRRTLLAGLAAGALPGVLASAAADDVIGGIERRHGGRLGVFVLDTGDGRSVQHRADERFPLASTFKGMLAAMVLHRVATGQDRLERTLSYGEADLVAVSPVTAPAVRGGRLAIGTLVRAILERSDNTAANLLLRHVGGPGALTAYVRTIGDEMSRFDRYEPVGTPDGEKDTSTPRQVAITARTLLLGDALPAAERAKLEGWMAGNVPGRTRLRAAFPREWTACDRTGTGDGVCNDYALARRPGRSALVAAAYYDAPDMALEAQEAVLREVGAAVVAWRA